jgi:Putative transposase
LFLDKLRAAYQADALQFFGKHARLIDPRAFAAYLAPLWNTKWVVYCKRPFGGPKQVLRYLARYTHRVAISNRRLIACDQKGVTFKWKDYRLEGPEREWQLASLHGHEQTKLSAKTPPADNTLFHTGSWTVVYANRLQLRMWPLCTAPAAPSTIAATDRASRARA